MNKTELIAAVAEEAGVSKTDAGKVINAVINNIEKTLAAGGNVALIGFGTFATSERAAREGRNPSTGATIKIPATVVPKFTAGSQLKAAVKPLAKPAKKAKK